MWTSILGFLLKLPGFIKYIGSMFSFIGKWWKKRQATKKGIEIDKAIQKAKKTKNTKDLQKEIGETLE